MGRRYSKYLPVFLFLTDIFLLNLAYYAASYITFQSPLLDQPYMMLVLFMNVAWAVLFIFLREYAISRITNIISTVKNLLLIVILHLLLVFAFFVLLNAFYYSKEFILWHYSVFAVLMAFWRAIFIVIIRRLRAKGYNFRKVIIVGYGEIATDLYEFFESHPEHGYRFFGFFGNNRTNPGIHNIDNVQEFALENEIDEIYCCLPHVRYPKVKQLVDFADNHLIKLKVISDFRGFTFKNLSIQHYDHIPVINVGSIPLDNAFNRFIKRTFDFIFSVLVIVFFLSWVFPIIAILIKLESKGPVFFKQYRHGKGNMYFLCWKFRTMHINQEADTKQATKNDPRITKVGAFLRKTSIDELPQFINVLLGDMSIVGPRPHPIKLNEDFKPIIDKFMTRHFVKPGITGLAQAKGFRGETKEVSAMINRVRFDKFYVENWSLTLDIKILILTVISILKGNKNAY